MRFSKYSIRIKNDQNTIIYNLITKTLLEVTCPIESIDTDFFSELDLDMENFLRDHLVIVEDDNDDYLQFLDIKENYNNQNQIGHFMIHLGYACNLKCSYCYQSTISKTQEMYSLDPDTIISFIKKTIDACHYDFLDICYIGGEPLIYWKEIEKISQAVNQFWDQDRVNYSVITNGTLLNRRGIMDKLFACGVKEYQVTLDGIKEDHDAFRNNGTEGSFTQIITNLQELHKCKHDLTIAINCNISQHNYTRIKDLIVFLKQHHIDYPLFFSMVFDNGINKKLEIKGLNEIWFHTHQIAITEGYSYDPFYRELYLGCALTQKNYHIIGADGKLYKCINGVGNNRYCLGDIQAYGSCAYENKINSFTNYKVGREECEACELYPICYGGCEYKNYLNGFHCDKESFYQNDIPLIKEFVNAKNMSHSKEFSE